MDRRRPGDTDDPPNVVDNSSEAGVPTTTDATSRRSVLVDLRIRFVQSISKVVSAFDGSPTDQDSAVINSRTWERSRLDIRLTAYSQAEALGENLRGTSVNADA